MELIVWDPYLPPRPRGQKDPKGLRPKPGHGLCGLRGGLSWAHFGRFAAWRTWMTSMSSFRPPEAYTTLNVPNLHYES